MNRFFTKSIALIALVAGITAISTSKAEAALSLFLCNVEFCAGGSVVQVNDGDATDVNGGVGAITYIGGFGGFSAFSVNSAIGIPIIGSDASPQTDLHFSAFGAGEGFIYAQQGPFNAPASPDPGSFTLNYGGTSTGQVWVQGVVGLAGDPFTTVGPFSGNFSGSLNLSGAAPYFQAIGVHIKQAGGATTGDLHLIPEPVSLTLLGLGLAGVAARRKRQVTA